MTTQKRGKSAGVTAPESDNLPLAPFTIKELRDVIPAHCFERSALRSGSYLLVDFLCIAGMFYIATLIDSYSPNVWLSYLILWPAYWFTQGAFMTGTWVVAHECGHQAFSDSKAINNFVGWVLHSLLLVPYHSWRITHGQHHKSTSHMDRDQVYVPKTLNDLTQGDDLHDLVSDSPLVNLVQIVLLLTVGWPAYLFFNVWSQKHSKRANHFEPSSPLFKPSQHLDIIVSDVGLVLAIALFSYCCYVFSVTSFVKYYFVPYLWVNFWLVLITYLQHTDIKVPHYRGEEWNFVRGALCTVDRDYGILNKVFHHIGDTHVAHHLFSTMPHYLAEEATEHIKKVLGKYYMQDKTPIMAALWQNWNTCHYVPNDGSVVYYQTLACK